MYSILKSTVNAKVGYSRADTTSAGPDPDPTDPWPFTDPVAHEFYQQKSRLEALKEDFRTYVMVAARWATEDLECKCELRRLLREGLLAADSSFGHLSPHPSIYYAQGEGEVKIAGVRYPIQVGDEVVFEPWLARLSSPGLGGPLRIGWSLQVTTESRLCCDAFPDICIHCNKTRALLRQILSYRKNPVIGYSSNSSKAI